MSEMLSGGDPKNYAATMSQQQNHDNVDKRLQSSKYPESPYDFETAAMPVNEEQTVFTPSNMFGILAEVKLCPCTLHALQVPG
jgi:hypothetical protein